MTKIKTIAAAVALASASTMAAAYDGTLPPTAPEKYDTGPIASLVDGTDMFERERAAFSIMEALLQMTEAKIHADGYCAPISGTEVPVTVYSFTSNNAADTIHFGEMGPQGNKVRVEAEIQPADDRGQQFDVEQINTVPQWMNPVALGYIDGTLIKKFMGTYLYNYQNNMMVGTMKVRVLGQNNTFDRYLGSVIKDFYKGEDNKYNDDFKIFDWGLQSLSKLGYPTEKYWQRSKVKRVNGSFARTVFVKDRLVGETICRITIDTGGGNTKSLYDQDGFLTVEMVQPDAEVPAFVDTTF